MVAATEPGAVREEFCGALDAFDDNPTGREIGCWAIVLFGAAFAFGAVLKLLSDGAGTSWKLHLAIWGPVVILVFYVVRAVRAFRRVERGTADRAALHLLVERDDRPAASPAGDREETAGDGAPAEVSDPPEGGDSPEPPPPSR